MVMASLSARRVYYVNMKHFDSWLQRHGKFTSLFLRVGLATVFLYAAVSSFLAPNDWLGYLPGFLRAIIPATVLLSIFSVVEIILAAWLLTGVYVRFAALVCVAMLLGIVVSNFSLLAISFRDIGLIFAALALAVSSSPEGDKPSVI